MQTIIATVKQQDKNTIVQIGDKTIATISPSFSHPGRYDGNFVHMAFCNNSRYVDAVEFITTNIERIFAENFGIEIKYAS